TIWSLPCFVTTGSETPRRSMRLRMMSTDLVMSSGVSTWPRGGCAWRTTSRPPWRSRPWRSFLWAGEPDQPMKNTPTRGARSSATSVSCERREAKLYQRLACLRRDLLFGFCKRDVTGDGRHGAAVEGDDRPGGDLDPELGLPGLADDPVDAACGDDLVALVAVVLHRLMGPPPAP